MARSKDIALKGPMPAPRYTGESTDRAFVGRERMHALRHHTMLSAFELGMVGAHAVEDYGGQRYWYCRDKLYFSAVSIGERISYAAY